ncbi:unnamed protein product, partial [Amoebophrya sp. A25]
WSQVVSSGALHASRRGGLHAGLGSPFHQGQQDASAGAVADDSGGDQNDLCFEEEEQEEMNFVISSDQNLAAGGVEAVIVERRSSSCASEDFGGEPRNMLIEGDGQELLDVGDASARGPQPNTRNSRRTDAQKHGKEKDPLLDDAGTSMVTAQDYDGQEIIPDG